MRWVRWLLGIGLTPDEPSPPRPPGAAVTYGELTGLPDGAVIGAGFAPGFGGALTCWRVWVYPDGRVRQEIHEFRSSVRDPTYRPVERAEEGQVGPDVAAALVSAAEVAGLRELAGRYEFDCTDQPRVSVVVRFPDGVRSVVVYGPWELFDRGHPGAAAALGVWLSVQRYAPWQPPWLQSTPNPHKALGVKRKHFPRVR
jgi:hypothetical protein